MGWLTELTPEKSSSSVCRSTKVAPERRTAPLPDHYDVGTTTTTMYDWAVVVEAYRRERVKPLIRRCASNA
ncbi:hypothetical protein OSTOST_25575 [Ostertagia ostertagi]